MNESPNLMDSRLTRVFRDVFDEPSLVLRPEMTAADVENWDSLTHINLIVSIEKEFKVRFTTGEVAGLKNVGDLQTLLSKKIEGQQRIDGKIA